MFRFVGLIRLVCCFPFAFVWFDYSCFTFGVAVRVVICDLFALQVWFGIYVLIVFVYFWFACLIWVCLLFEFGCLLCLVSYVVLDLLACVLFAFVCLFGDCVKPAAYLDLGCCCLHTLLCLDILLMRLRA